MLDDAVKCRPKEQQQVPETRDQQVQYKQSQLTHALEIEILDEGEEDEAEYCLSSKTNSNNNKKKKKPTKQSGQYQYSNR